MSTAELDRMLVVHIFICGVFGVLAFVAWQLLRNFVVLRLGPVPAGMRQSLAGKLLLGFVIGVIALWLMIWPAWFSGAFGDAAQGYMAYDPAGKVTQKSFWLLLRFFIFQSAGEELLYRGFALSLMATGIFAAAARYMRPQHADLNWMRWNWLLSGLAANLLVSVSFALFHGGNPQISGLGMINIGLAGLVLGQLFLNQASVAGAITLHITWNLGLAVLGLPVSGILVSQPQFGGIQGAGLQLISGGSFGPEGGLSCTAALLLLFAYLMWTGMPSKPAGQQAQAGSTAEQAEAGNELPAPGVVDAD